MDDLILNITIVPTFDVQSLSILDISTYPNPIPLPIPVYTMEITVPGFAIGLKTACNRIVFDNWAST